MRQTPYARALTLVVLALLMPVPAVGGQTVGTPAKAANTSILLRTSDATLLSVSAKGRTKLTPVDLRQGRLVARYNILKLVDERFFHGAKIERFFEMAQAPPSVAPDAPRRAAG